MEDWKKFEKLDSLSLIKLFQDKKLSGKERDLAFFVICYRFRKDLLNKCEIICKRFGHDVNVAEQIAESTFKSYARKGDFKLEKASMSNVDNSFKRYLYGIAKNELTNHYRLEEKKKKGHFYNGSERIVTDLPIPNSKLSTKDSVLLKAIQSLTPAQRTVYLTYKLHERVGCNLPKKLREELKEHLGGVSQTTIRGYKKEAIDKINSYLDVMNFTINKENGKF